MSRSTTPKRLKQRTLSITFTIDGQPYSVAPLDCEPDIGDRAFRFHKQGGDGAVYDLYHGRYGWQCQCLGFERYGYCRHSSALMKAAQLFGTPAALGGPAPRHPGHLPGNDTDPFQRVTDEQLAEAMEHAPEQPQPTEEEVNEMARSFGAD
jgi:hypothetical protein